MKWAWALLITAFASDALGQPAAPTIPRNAVWNYHAQGVNLGTAWREPGYDDTTWPTGPGILGYGEPYIDSAIPGGPTNNRYRTIYFRKSFDVDMPLASLLTMELEANHDDGLVAYINGQEVLRRAMPDGHISYNTFAETHEGGSYEIVDLTAHLDKLVLGENLMAVEIHQVSNSSSDMVMDLSLTVSDQPTFLTRGPYLQSATPNSVVVRWRTAHASDSRVNLGISLQAMTISAFNGAMTTEHEVEVTGLAPGTRYFYSVGTGQTELAGAQPAFTFETPPAPGTHQPVRLWVIGDSGTAGSKARSVRDAYYAFPGAMSTDVWLMLGDNAYLNGTDAQYQAAVFDMYPNLLRSTVLWPTRGNHDELHDGANNDYYEIFTLPETQSPGAACSGTEAYYSFDYANIHFVCLDSEGSDRSLGSCMLTWLEADLASTTQEWVIAFWHHPPYSKGSHDSDFGDSGGRLRDMRQNVLPILEAAGVDLVLSGHSHSYERSFLIDRHYGTSTTLTEAMKIDDGDGRSSGDGAYRKQSPGLAPNEGAVYAVAGSSGKIDWGPLDHPIMVSSLLELGSMVIDVEGLRLDAWFVNSEGAVRDSFTMFKGLQVGVAEATPVSGGPRLMPSQPNPFSRQARIDFVLPVSGPVKLSVIDLNGRRVRRLASGAHDAGRHAVAWDGLSDAGVPLPAGVYFAVLEAGGRTRATKLVLAR